MRKVIFVGFVYSEGLLNYAKEVGSSISYASNTFQRALLKGFSANDVSYRIVSLPLIESFPKIHKLYWRNKEFTWLDNTQGHIQLGMINIPIIKLLSWRYRLSIVLKKILREEGNDSVVVIYGVTSYTLAAIHACRKSIKHVHVVVPDLPEYMSGSNNYIYRIAKSIDRKIINKYLKDVDSFSLLTKYMKERLNVGNRDWLLLEGIYEDFQVPSIEKSKQKVFLYTGTLNARYGILDLLKAFSMMTGTNLRLWICGEGDSLDIVKAAANKDSRIEYLGLKTMAEVRQLQMKASFLVNPRHSGDEYTKYSFPSKTIEYLASGTPTIMCKLQGIPEEYYDHLFFFEDESVIGMRNKMEEISQLPEEYIVNRGRTAAVFIKEEKNCTKQVGRIVSLIEQSLSDTSQK